jgi:hypothetical protein
MLCSLVVRRHNRHDCRSDTDQLKHRWRCLTCIARSSKAPNQDLGHRLGTILACPVRFDKWNLRTGSPGCFLLLAPLFPSDTGANQNGRPTRTHTAAIMNPS